LCVTTTKIAFGQFGYKIFGLECCRLVLVSCFLLCLISSSIWFVICRQFGSQPRSFATARARVYSAASAGPRDGQCHTRRLISRGGCILCGWNGLFYAYFDRNEVEAREPRYSTICDILRYFKTRAHYLRTSISARRFTYSIDRSTCLPANTQRTLICQQRCHFSYPANLNMPAKPSPRSYPAISTCVAETLFQLDFLIQCISSLFFKSVFEHPCCIKQ